MASKLFCTPRKEDPMTYPNAYAGIKKIRTATILEIISVALLIAAAIFGLFAAGIIGDPTNEIAVDSFSLATVLTVLPVMILPFIALIIQIIGLGAAAKESSKFKTVKCHVDTNQSA